MVLIDRLTLLGASSQASDRCSALVAAGHMRRISSMRAAGGQNAGCVTRLSISPPLRNGGRHVVMCTRLHTDHRWHYLSHQRDYGISLRLVVAVERLERFAHVDRRHGTRSDGLDGGLLQRDRLHLQ